MAEKSSNKRTREATWISTADLSNLTNARFEAFYRSMPWVVPPEEFDAFMDSLRSSLPIAFRLNSCVPASIREAIKSRITTEWIPMFSSAAEPSVVDPTSTKASIASVDTATLSTLCWYPRGEGFALTAPRRGLARDATYHAFHNYLTALTAAGVVTRAEAVSMLPPLCLFGVDHTGPPPSPAVKSRVIDVCAAPGSKTSQLLEIIGAPNVSGLVVANDINADRCNMMTSQLNRLGSLSRALVITRHDATRNWPLSSRTSPMPRGGVQPPDATSSDAVRDAEKEDGAPLMEHRDECLFCNGPVLKAGFPFVVVDAVCSGDGTMRKALDMWMKWHFGSAAACHRLQTRIMRTAVTDLMLKPNIKLSDPPCANCAYVRRTGGLLVYSTCSLNPVEDEAVVASVLLEFPFLRLIDLHSPLPACIRKICGSEDSLVGQPFLPGLRRSRGVTKWHVMTRDDKIISRRSELSEAELSAASYWETMFAPETELSASLRLEYTMRLLPHHNDTGGFFVAMFCHMDAFNVSPMISPCAVLPVRPESMLPSYIPSWIPVSGTRSPADWSFSSASPVGPPLQSTLDTWKKVLRCVDDNQQRIVDTAVDLVFTFLPRSCSMLLTTPTACAALWGWLYGQNDPSKPNPSGLRIYAVGCPSLKSVGRRARDVERHIFAYTWDDWVTRHVLPGFVIHVDNAAVESILHDPKSSQYKFPDEAVVPKFPAGTPVLLKAPDYPLIPASTVVFRGSTTSVMTQFTREQKLAILAVVDAERNQSGPTSLFRVWENVVSPPLLRKFADPDAVVQADGDNVE